MVDDSGEEDLVTSDTSAQLDAMREAARHVDNAGQALAVIRGNIQQAVASTASGYTSPAASLFRNTMDQWSVDFQRIIGGLESMHQALTQTSMHYEATIDQERQSANDIAALLNGGGI